MNAQDLNGFEQSILNSGADLSGFDKSVPLKTAEEIRRDWLLERIGKFTASEFYKLTTAPTKKELPVGAITFTGEKVVEMLTEFLEERFVTKDMQWGIDHELEAIEEFEKRTNFKVDKTGINQELITLGKNIGGTPDGLIGKDSGIEVKCPKSTTHFKYLNVANQEDLKNVCADYYWQIQGVLYITGRKSWYFISYDPRFKNKAQQLQFIEVKPDKEDQKFLKDRLTLAVFYRDYLLEKVNMNFSEHIDQVKVLKLLKVGRTKLLKLRKSADFPAPIKKKPLLWRSVDIESYAIKKH